MFTLLKNILGDKRVVRFYDPDKHIIEVGENMKAVCKRFLDSEMTPEQVAEAYGCADEICKCLHLTNM